VNDNGRDESSARGGNRWRQKSHWKKAMLEALIRCSVFGFLGPVAGLLTLIVSGVGSGNLGLDTFVLVLVFAYLFGLVPALMTAAFDGFLDGRGARGIPRYLLTGAFGYAAAYVFPLMPLLIYQPRWGVIGSVPAAICSWITEKIINPVQKSRRA
jgi:hypothetical protein